MRHILLSNDDGIEARGLRVLIEVLEARDDVRLSVVAPTEQQSASSHSLTIRDPLRIVDYGPGRWGVTGTPTDCVLIAVEHLLRDDPPDLVISGVNHGSNMGEDVTYSGTVAAALEGAILGLPSYALSCTSWHPRTWDGVRAYLEHHLDELLDAPIEPLTLLNVNIPDLPPEEIRGVRAVPLGSRRYHDAITEQHDPRGRPFVWIGGTGPTWDGVPDTDATLNQEGYVVITPLKVDLTHHELLGRIRTLDRDDFGGGPRR